MDTSFNIEPFNFMQTPLAGAFVITPTLREDNRGWLYRTYDKQIFEQIHLVSDWMQMSHTITYKKGTVRGMHFQYAPHTETKMLRCVAGAVLDVIVDLRKGSSTFLHWFGVELSATNKKSMYLPQGFAHGFQALEDNCELVYQHSAYYNPSVESGIRFDDPRIDIKWPLPIEMVSDLDKSRTFLEQNFEGLTII